MFKIDDEKTIHITRGDAVTLLFTAKIQDTDENYTFQKGDIVRFVVTEKKDESSIVLSKDIKIEEETTVVEIPLTSKETRIGDIINKPVNYWYEIELNPDSNSDTMLGYDEDNAKIFKLYPESGVK